MKRSHAPGAFLLKAASRLCDAHSLEQVVRPAVADLQHEYAHAVEIAGGTHTAQVAAALARGYLGCWRALLWCLAFDREPPTDLSFGGRLLAVSLLSVGLASGLLLWSIGHVERMLWDRAGSIAALHATLYLLPGAITIALPPAALAMMLVGRRGKSPDAPPSSAARSLGADLALPAVATAAALVLVGWLVPLAHDAWRYVVSSYLAGPAAGVLLPRDLTDMTLAELWRLRDAPPAVWRGPLGGQALVDLWIQTRLASAAACLTFAAVGVSLLRGLRPLRLPGIAAVMLITSATYLEVWGRAVAAARADVIPVAVGAWGAHVPLILTALLVWMVSRHLPSALGAG